MNAVCRRACSMLSRDMGWRPVPRWWPTSGVDVISFTGSTAVDRQIAAVAGGRLAKVSLELGGKNPLVVCDDADLENACKWVLLSAFSNAGQRCAAGSRIIILDTIYGKFRDMLVAATEKLNVGSHRR